MLTLIEVVYGNESGEQIVPLPILGVTPKDSLLIRKVTGLNPPDRDLFIGDYARDGGYYDGSRVGNRNVVMTIDLNPDPALGETVPGLRNLLYKTFMDPLVDSDAVEIRLHDDDGNVYNLFGYTEKIETDLFDIETMAQVSMICPDPFVRDLLETVLTNSTGTWVSVPFTYSGTSETGFEAQIIMTADHGTLTLNNNGKTMVFTHPFLAGDVININTNPGERSVTLTRAGVTTSLLAKLAPASPWLLLHSQANTMSVSGALPTNIVAGIKTLTYRGSYWGL